MENLVNNFAEVKFDRILNALSVKFLQFTPHEEFVKIVDREFELIHHYKLKKCIIDLRSFTTYATGTPEFVKDVWFPKVISLGLRYAAFVNPEKPIANMGMKKAHEETPALHNLDVKHFKDLESAKEWLKTCK